MIQEALRQAMMISPGAKSSGPKTVSGTSFYAWGAGAQGQLGQPVVKGQLRSMNTPTTIQFEDLSDTLVRASCGAGHVASLTDSGEVWAWGYGRSGQLGYVMDRSTNQPQPKKVDTLVKVRPVPWRLRARAPELCGSQRRAPAERRPLA